MSEIALCDGDGAGFVQLFVGLAECNVSHARKKEREKNKSGSVKVPKSIMTFLCKCDLCTHDIIVSQ